MSDHGDESVGGHREVRKRKITGSLRRHVVPVKSKGRRQPHHELSSSTHQDTHGEDTEEEEVEEEQPLIRHRTDVDIGGEEDIVLTLGTPTRGAPIDPDADLPMSSTDHHPILDVDEMEGELDLESTIDDTPLFHIPAEDIDIPSVHEEVRVDEPTVSDVVPGRLDRRRWGDSWTFRYMGVWMSRARRIVGLLGPRRVVEEVEREAEGEVEEDVEVDVEGEVEVGEVEGEMLEGETTSMCPSRRWRTGGSRGIQGGSRGP